MKTIGNVRVASWSAGTARLVLATRTWCDLDQFLGTLTKKIGLAFCPAVVDPARCRRQPSRIAGILV